MSLEELLSGGLQLARTDRLEVGEGVHSGARLGGLTPSTSAQYVLMWRLLRLSVSI